MQGSQAAGVGTGPSALDPPWTKGCPPLALYSRLQEYTDCAMGHSSQWMVLLPAQTHTGIEVWVEGNPTPQSVPEAAAVLVPVASYVSGHQPVFLPRSGTQGSAQQVMLELIQMQHIGGH